MNLRRREAEPRLGRVAAAVAGLLAAVLALGVWLVLRERFDGTPAIAAGTDGPVLAAEPKSAVDFGVVPPFALQDPSGRTVTLDDLRGHPWVMATIFTRCTGPCPAITARLADLQRRFAGTDVRLVAISVDPEFDRGEVLADYAETWGADPERWWFLSGSREAIADLVTGGFHMAAVKTDEPGIPVGEALTHDTRLVAVDRQGHIRGWYDQDVDAEVGRLVERLRFLDRN